MWTPPTQPDPRIATPDEIVAEAREMNGAAYRIQPSGRIPQADNQIPYWAGFTRTVHQYGQQTQAEVGLVGVAPPPDSPVGDRRPRVSGMKDVGPQGPHPTTRTNVLSRATHQETTGEDPAPLFTKSQATGRS